MAVVNYNCDEKTTKMYVSRVDLWCSRLIYRFVSLFTNHTSNYQNKQRQEKAHTA